MRQPTLIEPERFCSFCCEPTSQPRYQEMDVCLDCAEADPQERVTRALKRWGRR